MHVVDRDVEFFASLRAGGDRCPREGGAAGKLEIAHHRIHGPAHAPLVGRVDGTSTLISFPGQQSFGTTPTYTALLTASLQLIQDSFRQDLSDGNAGGWTGNGTPPVYDGVPTGNGDLTDLLASAAVESIGRQVASVGSTALYAAATTGQEASLGTLISANLAKLIGLVDPAYLRMGCSYYMSNVDAATVFGASGVLANAGSLSLFGFPVEITNAATNWTTGSVTGPVFGRLDRFMSMRRVNGVTVLVLGVEAVAFAALDLGRLTCCYECPRHNFPYKLLPVEKPLTLFETKAMTAVYPEAEAALLGEAGPFF